MVKLMGILLAVIGCSAAGLMKASNLKERKRLLLDFKNLLLHISTEISYFKEPLPQIFRRLAAETEGESAELLRNCLTSYLTCESSMNCNWKKAANIVYKETALTEEDLAIVKKCGDFLGQSDYKGQQNHFELLHNRLDGQIAEAAEEIRTKGKMYSRLGMSAGCIIAVVMM